MKGLGERCPAASMVHEDKVHGSLASQNLRLPEKQNGRRFRADGGSTDRFGGRETSTHPHPIDSALVTGSYQRVSIGAEDKPATPP
jgi:hypothetical protein